MEMKEKKDMKEDEAMEWEESYRTQNLVWPYEMFSWSYLAKQRVGGGGISREAAVCC
ncbi:hypothetical protein F2Q68_00039019 [Brassica cretica]|uniref:Uncharacterized protein n=2 Tax=Brassica cretica TaxID=69181 RepID=A0A8S9MHB9_BRACR|nr:hypothetical protein F2Q68_00039019 [Brassica cretica]KAF3495037.1 hypothetical protein DY000_02052600 [Brassica cretica]